MSPHPDTPNLEGNQKANPKFCLLTRRQYLEHPLEKVFAFFQSPENLARITPPWLNFSILTPSPVVMKPGAVIEYSIRWVGIPLGWTTRITMYEPPYRFVDEQIHGPYSLWHHTHSFQEKDGGTDMLDEVRYALPFGIVGRIMERYVVRRQLEQIFDFRFQAIQKIFPALVKHSPSRNERELLSTRGNTT